MREYGKSSTQKHLGYFLPELMILMILMHQVLIMRNDTGSFRVLLQLRSWDMPVRWV